ncbi:MAG: hypothetical protein ACJ746_18410 [Bryobacteraceae bacterium]
MEIFGTEIRVRGNLIRVAFVDGEGYQFLRDPAAALTVLRKSGRRPDVFTFIQRLSDTSPNYGYPIEWDNFAVLSVTSFDDWMTRQIDFKVRNKIRKAEKNGVVVREVAFDLPLVRGISAIYNESPIRQGKRFWHYGKDLEAVRSMNGTFINRSIFIGAFVQDELIGFVKLVSDEDQTQAGLMQIVSMIRHRDKAPTNALIAQAVRSCAERGIPYLWYANFSYGKKQRDTLADFKRYNGFEKVDVPRYYVPLTLVGRMALRLGLHHAITERIPEPVASGYRKMRSLWYGRRFPGFENA